MMDFTGEVRLDLLCELRADWWSPGGGAESPEGDGWYACPAGGYFSVMKSRQKNFI